MIPINADETLKYKREWIREYRANNSNTLEYKVKNRVWDNAYKERHKEKLKEKAKEYRSKNKETMNEKSRLYRLNNKEKLKESQRTYYLKNKEKCIAKRKKWIKENPQKMRMYKKANLSRRRALGHISVKIVQRVYEENIKKYGTLTCYLCLKPIEFGQDNLEHKMPISRGGTNEYSNLEIAHSLCNLSKGRKTLEEFCQI